MARFLVYGFGGYDPDTEEHMPPTNDPGSADEWKSGRPRAVLWTLFPMPEKQKESARRLGLADQHHWEKWPAIGYVEEEA